MQTGLDFWLREHVEPWEGDASTLFDGVLQQILADLDPEQRAAERASVTGATPGPMAVSRVARRIVELTIAARWSS